jgi:hypothetical protein
VKGGELILKRLSRVTLAAVTCFLLYASTASAAGIGVAPGKMEFTVRPGGTGAKNMHVINQDAGESIFQVYVEGENKRWFTVTPGEFTLDSQEKRGVEISVAAPIMAKPGEYDLSICVISMPLGDELRVGAGIKVKTHLEVTSLPVMALQWWIVSAVILAIVAIGGIVWLIRRRRYA